MKHTLLSLKRIILSCTTLFFVNAINAQCEIKTQISENFDAQATGSQFNANLPNCWSILKSSTETIPYIHVSGFSSNKFIKMYNMTYTDGYLILVSPETDNLGNGTKRLRFKYIADEGSEIKIVSLASPNSTDGMVVIETLVVEEDVWDYEEHIVNLPVGTNSYFGIAHGLSDTYQFIEIDDIFYEEIPSGNEVPNVTAVNITAQNNASNVLTENGNTLSLVATVNPQAVSQEVTWSIQPESIATINSNGVVTAVSNGIATVKATSVADSTIFGQYGIIVDTADNVYCTPRPVQFQINAPTSPITLVQFGQNGVNGINQTSSSVISNETPKYENFSNISMDVEIGQTYTLKVEGTTGNPLDNTNEYDDYVVVYIDWNNDGVFSNSLQGVAPAREKYQEDVPEMNSTNQSITYNITIPEGVSLGEKRMRIAKSNQMVSGDPCNPAFLFGQVEDYTINVVNATSNPETCVAVSTFTETFEDFTTFPEHCWTGNLPTYPYTSITDNETIQLYSGNQLTEVIIVSPEVTTIDGQHKLSFDIVSTTGAGTQVQVGTMSSNSDFATFVAAENAFTPTVGTYSSSAINPVDGHKYLAIKYIHGGGHGKVLELDNIEWSVTASNSKFDTSKVKIYPNPTTESIFIESELDIKQIEVFNSLGQKIIKSNETQINLSNVANGLYFITVETSNGAQATYKIVKK